MRRFLFLRSNTSSESGVNDLRVSRFGTEIVSVITQRRYPRTFMHLLTELHSSLFPSSALCVVCVELYDLVSEQAKYIHPSDMLGRWVHAVELGPQGTLNEILAIGESVTTGMFAVMGLDLRVKKV